MPRYRESERDSALAKTRQALLKAAVHEFATKGFADANINRISTAAGFAKGTIYNYFPSKEALMVALLTQLAEAHLAFVADEVRARDDPEYRLRGFFEAGFVFVERYQDEAKVLITTLYGGESGFRKIMGGLYQHMCEFVAVEILAPGIQQGIFRPVNLMSAATLIMTTYLGASSQVDENGKPYLDPEQVADFALRGLCVETLSKVG